MLRDNLGMQPEGRPHRGNHLALHEVNELLRRGALAAGLIPYPEHFSTEKAVSRLRLDWSWCAPRAALPAAFFEVEGIDAHKRGLVQDRKKFDAARRVAPDALLVLVMFNLDKTYQPKRRPSGGAEPRARAREYVGRNVEIIFDAELMALGGIERLINQAKGIAAQRTGTPV